MRTILRTMFAVTYQIGRYSPITTNVAAPNLESALTIVRNLEPGVYPTITKVEVMQTVNGSGIYVVEGDY